MDSFSEILQEFLKINSLTQKNFAEAIEVKPSQVSEWLKGKVVPGYYSLSFRLKGRLFLRGEGKTRSLRRSVRVFVEKRPQYFFVVVARP